MNADGSLYMNLIPEMAQIDQRQHQEPRDPAGGVAQCADQTGSNRAHQEIRKRPIEAVKPCHLKRLFFRERNDSCN